MHHISFDDPYITLYKMQCNMDITVDFNEFVNLFYMRILQIFV